MSNKVAWKSETPPIDKGGPLHVGGAGGPSTPGLNLRLVSTANVAEQVQAGSVGLVLSATAKELAATPEADNLREVEQSLRESREQLATLQTELRAMSKRHEKEAAQRAAQRLEPVVVGADAEDDLIRRRREQSAERDARRLGSPMESARHAEEREPVEQGIAELQAKIARLDARRSQAIADLKRAAEPLVGQHRALLVQARKREADKLFDGIVASIGDKLTLLAVTELQIARLDGAESRSIAGDAVRMMMEQVK